MFCSKIFLASSSVKISSFPSTAFRSSGWAMYAPKPVARVDAEYVVPFKSMHDRNLQGIPQHFQKAEEQQPKSAPFSILEATNDNIVPQRVHLRSSGVQQLRQVLVYFR